MIVGESNIVCPFPGERIAILLGNGPKTHADYPSSEMYRLKTVYVASMYLPIARGHELPVASIIPILYALRCAIRMTTYCTSLSLMRAPGLYLVRVKNDPFASPTGRCQSTAHSRSRISEAYLPVITISARTDSMSAELRSCTSEMANRGCERRNYGPLIFPVGHAAAGRQRNSAGL